MSQQTNLREFSTIAALILKAAFSNFPVATDLDFSRIAESMGLKNLSANLDSGRAFSTVASHTLKWLIDNEYVRAGGVFPRDRVIVTDKGLTAMNNKSPRSGISFSDEIEEASRTADTNEGRQRLAEVVSSFFGSAVSSFTKGLSGA
jgi:hypothetical protein